METVLRYPPERLSKDYRVIDPEYFLPTEVETLLGDPAKTSEQLG